MAKNLEYVSLTPEEWAKEGPTAGVATLVGRTSELNDGRHIALKKQDCGQGAEKKIKTQDPLYKALTEGGIKLDTGEYHTSPGGSIVSSESELLSIRGMTADYARNIYRLPASDENTFLVQTLGRTMVDLMLDRMVYNSIDRMCRKASIAFKPILGLADEHWGTLSVLAADHHLSVRCFDNRNPNPADAIVAFLDELKDKNELYALSGILLNYPLNPTSQEIDAAQMSRVIQYVSTLNAQYNLEIQLLFDMPYAFACERDAQNGFLKTGIENTLDNIDNVRWAMVASTSKLLSLAKTGQSILVVDKVRAKDIATRLSNNGSGIARFTTLTRNVAEILAGKNQDILWKRKNQLREKYMEGDTVLSEAFGKALVPGGVGMLRLVELPVEKIFNQAVMCCDGVERQIRTGLDFTTYLLNNHSVAVVPCGVRNNQLRLRWAKRDIPAYLSGSVEAAKAGLEAVNEGRILDNRPYGPL